MKDDVHRNLRQHLGKASLISEGAQERSLLKVWQDARWDASTQVYPTGRHDLKRQVSRLAAQDGNKKIERFDTNLHLTCDSSLDDQRGWIRCAGEFFAQQLGFGGALCISEERVKI